MHGPRNLWNRRLPINFSFWLPALVYFNWLQYLLLDEFGGIALNYRFLVWFAACLNSILFTLALILVDSLVESSTRGWLRWFWGGCAGLIVASFFVDFCLYRMMAIHLH